MTEQGGKMSSVLIRSTVVYRNRDANVHGDTRWHVPDLEQLKRLVGNED